MLPWRRPDGAAISYMLMVFGAAAICLATREAVPSALEDGGNDLRFLGAVGAFVATGLFVGLNGRVGRRAVHPLSLIAIAGGNAMVSCIDDPVAQALAAGWNVLIVMYLSTSLSRRWVFAYGVLCTVAANLMLLAQPASGAVLIVRVVVLTGLVFLPLLFFLLLRGELDAALAVAQDLATKDALTGLLNRRGMQEAFPVLASATLQEAQHVAVLVCDIDHFKRINDRYGHEVGDAVLSEVSDSLSRNVRITDVIVRLGGEEIAVFASVLDEADARWCAERLRAQVERDCGRWEVTISIGISLSAAIPREQYGEALDALLREADGRLYEAKQGGRNRVVGPARLPHGAVPPVTGGSRPAGALPGSPDAVS